MNIAQAKRQENIAEYVLYLWQLEDLLRALQFSPEAIYSQLIVPRGGSEEWNLAALEWYVNIAELLEKEGKEQSGHLDHTLHIVADLNDLHLLLLQQPVGKEYRELFARLAPALPRLREVLGNKDISDIELAFRALYAAMLYRIKGEKSELADEVTALVSPVVASLADIFHRAERGEIDLYKAQYNKSAGKRSL
jgi:hypothetical protein